ncbi:MAG TPA: nitrilase-related carbon-nitrogen hydrolase, partial [Kiloniellaceae bacterium]|nr:nitrilase-related carbon-nitrogen hydrolase [Kiloniellaceae bacterium]
MSSPAPFTLALWATNLSTPVNGLEAWAAQVEAKLAEAAAAGAKLLVMPEYACEAWLSFKPDGLSPAQEIAWMAAQAPAALDLLRPLPARHGVGLLAGTMPWAADGGFTNRAWLLLPDGRVIGQDKLCLTPGEQDPESWNLLPGDA